MEGKTAAQAENSQTAGEVPDTISELRRRYAAAQFAAAHSNSRFSAANREVSELRARLEELRDKLGSDQQYIRLLTEEKALLEGEAAELRLQNEQLILELASYKESAERAANQAKQAAENLHLAQSENLRLQQLIQQKDAQLAAIISSTSFKLGRSATGIVRRIPGLSRRA